MASSYSTNYRFELPATSEQKGTWGVTNNTNLGTLIEEALGGYALVTMTDANYTLTALNGVTDEARCNNLKIAGTLTASRNVVCPAIEKSYTVWNATTGGFSIVFKTSGGSGVTIPNGSKAQVFVDGTNVVEVIQTSSLNPNLFSKIAVSGQSDVTVDSPTTTLNFAAGSNMTITTNNGTKTVTFAASGGGGSTFPSGTVMLFVQTSAPTGWTKSTTHNNKALRVVSGSVSSGGTVDFTAAFASKSVSGTVSGTVGNTTLTIAQIPSHQHTVMITQQSNTTTGGALLRGVNLTDNGTGGDDAGSTSLTGGGGSHTHTWSGSFSGTSIDLAVKYVDAIIATKD